MLNIKTIKLRSEAEILTSWNNPNQIVVSVVCTTFNHESYIEDAITGFLMQETDFAFEIIIHDDASTDATAKIIKSYHDNYPQIIKPVIQSENQYSKGSFKPSIYASGYADGDYVALCEGDDYWLDKNKLQRQYYLMEQHKNVDISIHNAEVWNADPDKDYQFPERENKVYTINVEEAYKTRLQFAPTASYFVRTEALLNLPPLFYSAPTGDFFIEFIIGRKDFLYLPDKMSLYRREAAGSWSITTHNNLSKKIEFHERFLKSLSELETFLGKKEGRFVKYRKQYVHLSLTRSYIAAQKVRPAVFHLIKSFKGSFANKRMQWGFVKDILKMYYKSLHTLLINN